MALLKCPLCCEEEFDCNSSLKYHILSVIENLFCPVCNERCENLHDLAEHVGSDCRKEEENMTIEGEVEEEVEEEDVSSNNVKFEILSDIKYEDVADVGEETPFLCQICNIHIKSVEEHLEEFHAGEEIIVETDQGDSETEEIHIETAELPTNRVVEEHKYIGEDGKIYIKKTFSDDSSIAEPIIETYVLEKGLKNKKKKITADEEVTDDDSVVKVHRCPKCYLQFPKLKHYFKHLCNPQKMKQKFKCVHCSTVCNCADELNNHMITHLEKDVDGTIKRVITMTPHTCNVCNTMFPSYKSLKLHQRMHDPVKMKQVDDPVNYTISTSNENHEIVREMFICTICNNSYDKEYQEVHMRSHDDTNDYNCTVCNKKFHTKENLEMHGRAHNSTKKFSCSCCKKNFISYTGLQEHIDTRCQNRRFECQYCGRKFNRAHEKVKHERIHTGERPHVCHICGKTFRVSYCLTLHLRTHSGTRPYECKQCGKRFKSHSVFNHHSLTHSDVRSYECPYCPKAFKTRVQLAGHKNSHVKPFTCPQCNRPFASLYAVRAHMNNHKQDNLKFDCYVCGATYARPFALRDHMKNQHSIDGNEVVLESAEICNEVETEVKVEANDKVMINEEEVVEEGNE